MDNNNNNLLTLNSIKSEWERTHSLETYISLEDFIRENYTQLYDNNLNFLGYIKGGIAHKN